MKRFISYILWPGLMASAIAVNAYGMSTDMPLLWLNISYFGLALAIFCAERLMPHEARWNESDGQLWPDIGHTLLSKSTVQVLIIVPALTGIGALASTEGAIWWPRDWPVAAQIALGLIIAEFGFYWAHRLCHEIRALWRFHAVHHSVTRLWFVNTGRFHFIDTMISVAFGLGVALTFGLPQDIIVWVSAITAYIGLLTHTNAEMRTGILDYVFNTPALHRWHHSRVPEEGNRNYGENLMLYDVAFGTHFVSRRRPPVDIGINEPMPATLGAQIAHPFRRQGSEPHTV
jgi:sterol desaturase/sphingolipid hydroxylase (fatty acid hydroxylase superfamily)